jgi:hypothetical protein
VDSVNRSESGYERVHQGLAILINDLIPDGGRLHFEVTIEVGEDDEG